MQYTLHRHQVIGGVTFAYVTQLERTERRFIGFFRDFRDEEVLKTIFKCLFHIFENVFFCNLYRPQRVEKVSNYVLNLTVTPSHVKLCAM